jgi:hypothetical protein
LITLIWWCRVGTQPWVTRLDCERLTLRVAEGAAHEVALRAAHHVERAPEFRRPHLVGHVLEHPDDLAALDLVIELSAELSVVTLLVDGEAAVHR